MGGTVDAAVGHLTDSTTHLDNPRAAAAAPHTSAIVGLSILAVLGGVLLAEGIARARRRGRLPVQTRALSVEIDMGRLVTDGSEPADDAELDQPRPLPDETTGTLVDTDPFEMHRLPPPARFAMADQPSTPTRLYLD